MGPVNNTREHCLQLNDQQLWAEPKKRKSKMRYSKTWTWNNLYPNSTYVSPFPTKSSITLLIILILKIAVKPNFL